MPQQARQGSEVCLRDWSWVEASVWTPRMLEALGNGVQGGKWFSLIDKVSRLTTLQAAWEKVKANKGAAGIDRQSVTAFGHQAPCYLQELQEALKAGTYRPAPLKRVEVPKGPKETRPLGIPVVKDRVVQTAMKMVIEPVFEATFLDTSFGFRPGRGAKGALREVFESLKEGYTHVVDADLQRCFDTIDHARLRQRVAERISDGRVLQILDLWLSQEVVSELDRWTPENGTPQGAVISPLLANCFLHPLDAHMAERGFRMVRYADDFVVLCQSEQQAEAALLEVKRWVEANGLLLHPEKTHVVDARQPGLGFDFLGYHFEAGKRWPRKKSLQKVRDRVRELTRRTRGSGLAKAIKDLNPVLRGWFAYFKHARKLTFEILDGFVRRRLRSILRKFNKKQGRSGRSKEDHRRWPNAFFAEQGLFTLTAAHAAAIQSRCR